jgi:hypothetical protein
MDEAKIIEDLRRDLRLAMNKVIIYCDMTTKLTEVLCEHDLSIEAAQIVGIQCVEEAQKVISNDC